MADIKTRENYHGIKVLDKSVTAGERMKKAFIRSKSNAQNMKDEEDTSPSEYAENKSRDVVEKVASVTSRSVRTVKKVRKNIKSAKKSIKTVQKSSKAAAKTTTTTVKASQKAQMVAKETARLTIQAAKLAIRAIIAATKAVVAGAKALIAAISAGGWVAVLIILVLCVVALVFGYCFGIFFPEQGNNSGPTIYDAVQELKVEYQNEIETIKANNAHDELEIPENELNWPEILSVYAVMVTTDSNTMEDISIITEEKEELLKNIFWEMNVLSCSMTTNTETLIIKSEDGHGNVLEEEVQVTITTLQIENSQKSAYDMAQEYSFNEDQKEQMEVLLESDFIWQELLGGVVATYEYTNVII